jgi:hypothetical protein
MEINGAQNCQGNTKEEQKITNIKTYYKTIVIKKV